LGQGNSNSHNRPSALGRIHKKSSYVSSHVQEILLFIFFLDNPCMSYRERIIAHRLVTINSACIREKKGRICAEINKNQSLLLWSGHIH